jgi:hypothetical protein
VAVDIKAIIAELTAFHDFKDKTVISVGAGGGQMVEFARAAITRFTPKNRERRETIRVFAKYEDLYQKLKVMGEMSLSRIKEYMGRTDIRIPMLYGFAPIQK